MVGMWLSPADSLAKLKKLVSHPSNPSMPAELPSSPLSRAPSNTILTSPCPVDHCCSARPNLAQNGPARIRHLASASTGATGARAAMCRAWNGRGLLSPRRAQVVPISGPCIADSNPKPPSPHSSINNCRLALLLLSLSRCSTEIRRAIHSPARRKAADARSRCPPPSAGWAPPPPPPAAAAAATRGRVGGGLFSKVWSAPEVTRAGATREDEGVSERSYRDTEIVYLTLVEEFDCASSSMA
jgi:hypothetical protein